MAGRVSLVTGASSGIGYATALELAKRGATVVLVCRDPSRGSSAQKAIQEASDNPSVHLLLGDLSSAESIQRVHTAFREQFSTCHLLVNNAGALFSHRTLSVDGIEMTFALNHLGYFRLTSLLLDLLVRSAPSRIVNVASEVHRFTRLNFNDLQHEHSYSPLKAYARSKLANILFTYELARRLAGTGVTANAMHPGMVRTRFYDSATGATRLFSSVFGWTFRSPARGAATVVYLASESTLHGVTGMYFRDTRAVRSSAYSRDPAIARRLWEISDRWGERIESIRADAHM